MRAQRLLFPAGLAIGALAIWVGCGGGSGTSPLPTPIDDAGDAGALLEGAAPMITCPPCTTDQDCAGGSCAQLGGDSYCASACHPENVGHECAEDRACTPVSTVEGQQASVCVPRGDVCGASATEPDASMPSDTCGTLVAPKVVASCICAAGQTCAANKCYGGWWCNTATNRCQPAPATCDGPGDSGAAFDGGGPVTASIGATGGTSSRLLFGVVGDSRPANPDDTAGYPTAIVTKIFTGIEALAARPPFVVATGDYLFAYKSSNQAAPQLDLYLGARKKYSGVFFPALGNHECTSATASNCGPDGMDGMPANYIQFLSKLLAPISKTQPYYAINVAAPDASWTAKFVFVAANAWSAAQATWLESALTPATTYTFVVRHESKAADTAPGVIPSEQIMAAHPYTLALVGHTHTYAHYAGREVIIGNGGAPLTGSKNYGFAIVNQRPDRAIQVDMIDYETGLSDARFRFAVKPDGSPAP